MTFEERRKTIELMKGLPKGTVAALESLDRWNRFANDECARLGELLSSSGDEGAQALLQDNVAAAQERVLRLVDDLIDSGTLAGIIQLSRIASMDADA